jgi:hypothetical protein
MLLFLISIHKLEIFVVNEATTWSGVGRSFDFHFYPHLDAEIRTSLQEQHATPQPRFQTPDSTLIPTHVVQLLHGLITTEQKTNSY